MNEGTVQALGKSRTGKPTVTINGQIYSASKVDLGTLTVGDRISFDSASSVYNGATVWFLNAWKLLEGAPKYPGAAPLLTTGSAPIASQTAPQGLSVSITEGERAAISNWVAHAISAGIIKTPQEISSWVQAAKKALRE